MCGQSAAVAVALALVACACFSLAQPQGDLFTVEARTRNGGSVYCGSRLSEALKLMCNGEYNSYFKSKKTSPPAGPADEYWAPPVQLPFRERLRAAAFLDSRTRFTRGVYDECCHKSCTLDEMMSYCAKNPRNPA